MKDHYPVGSMAVLEPKDKTGKFGSNIRRVSLGKTTSNKKWLTNTMQYYIMDKVKMLLRNSI